MKELINIGEIMPTKENISIVADSLLQPIKDGNMDKVEVAVRSKFIIEVLTKVLENIEISENTTCLGAKIECCEIKPKYYFEECDKWNEIKQKIKPLVVELKKVEELIKIATKKGQAFTDLDTGETIMPVSKESKTGFKITLGK